MDYIKMNIDKNFKEAYEKLADLAASAAASNTLYDSLKQAIIAKYGEREAGVVIKAALMSATADSLKRLGEVEEND